MYVPYGFVSNVKNGDMRENFFSFEDRYEDITKVVQRDLQHITVMTLFVRDAWNRRLFGLEQRFKAEFIPQYVVKHSGFRYRHSDRDIIITRLLGSINPKTIDDQAKLLMKECSRYLMMYCKLT